MYSTSKLKAFLVPACPKNKTSKNLIKKVIRHELYCKQNEKIFIKFFSAATTLKVIETMFTTLLTEMVIYVNLINIST